MVRQSPRTSAIARAYDPDVEWSLAEHLLALIFDAAQISNWQRAAGKRHEMPKPFPRPGVEPDGKRLGSGNAISIEEMDRALGWDESVKGAS